VGEINYGVSEIKSIYFLSSVFNVGNISKIERLGCGACSQTTITDSMCLPEDGLFLGKFKFNSHPQVKQEYGEYKDAYKLIDKNLETIARIPVCL
jgi:hypothetical protein